MRPVNQRFAAAVMLVLMVFGGVASSQGVPTEVTSEASLLFVENTGQLAEEIDFSLRAADRSVHFTSEGVVFVLGTEERWIVVQDFVDCRAGVVPEGRDARATKISYFRGRGDSSSSHARVFAQIAYRDLWPGIDLVYSTGSSELKYELIVRPGADPENIRFAYRGATEVTLTSSDGLSVTTPVGGFSDSAPVAFQEASGETVDVPVAFDLSDDASSYGFRIGPYDHEKTLVIDPAVVVYCGYVGGADDDEGNAVAVDSEGNAYIAGRTASSEVTFPVVVGPAPRWSGGYDAFVAKVSGVDAELIYCGYIGGDLDDEALAIAVDDAGNVYVAGITESDENSFPVSGGPFTAHGGGKDAFVAKVDPAGASLLYCGFVGGEGDDEARGIAVDSSGNAYLTGGTTSSEATFPVRVGPAVEYGGDMPFPGDAFVAKVSSSGADLVYCGYIGGAWDEAGAGIAVGADDSAYVTGWTQSPADTFPVLVGPYLTHGAGKDAFVAKVDPGGASLVYCGYIGGLMQDEGTGIAIDAAGSAYVSGATGTPEWAFFPVLLGPDVVFNGGFSDGFVAKVTPDGGLLDYCGYIGGTHSDRAEAIVVDESGSAYVTGSTHSSEQSFPASVGPDLTHNGGEDAFVAKIPQSGTHLEFCGYVGGLRSEAGSSIALDSESNVYLTGATTSRETSFPVYLGPDSTQNGLHDTFVAMIATRADEICRRGGVNLGASPSPAPVLSLNGSHGELDRTVSVLVDTPIDLFMDAAPAGPSPGAFALYVWIGEPSESTVTPHPLGLGDTCFPTFLAGGMPKPHKVWNNAGYESRLGQPNFPSQPAPSVVVSRPAGWPRPVQATLQGFIRDNASAAQRAGSITNAVVLEITR